MVISRAIRYRKKWGGLGVLQDIFNRSLGSNSLSKDWYVNIEYRETFKSGAEGEGVLYEILSDKFIV